MKFDLSSLDLLQIVGLSILICNLPGEIHHSFEIEETNVIFCQLYRPVNFCVLVLLSIAEIKIMAPGNLLQSNRSVTQQGIQARRALN